MYKNKNGIPKIHLTGCVTKGMPAKFVVDINEFKERTATFPVFSPRVKICGGVRLECYFILN